MKTGDKKKPKLKKATVRDLKAKKAEKVVGGKASMLCKTVGDGCRIVR